MKIRAIVLLLNLLISTVVLAQAVIRLPERSPQASVGQTLGVTDISIAYHRPAVNKRKIWGGLVPYGVLWRAGANENTTISFSTPVKVEGQPLSAGTYGLYLIAGPTQWTVVLSKFAGDWGTYNYDPSEDAGRVSVTPQVVNENQERLAYTFDDLTNASVVASMRWEKLRVPVKIEVDLPATVRASMRNELRSGKHWSSDAWTAAARWELRNGDADTALKYADNALDMGVTSGALRTKAAVLEKKGDTKGAAELRERAKQIANDAEIIGYTADGLLNDKKYDEAISYLTTYLRAHPNSPHAWRAYAYLGQVYGEKGDQVKAREAFDKAMAAARDATDRAEIQDFVNTLGAEGKL
jgi:tetratricopeptide (TPR) repeat protein